MLRKLNFKIVLVLIFLLCLGAFLAGIFSGLLSRSRYTPPKIQFGLVVRSGDLGKQLRDARSGVGCPVALIGLDCVWDDAFPYNAAQFISKKGAVPVFRWMPLFADAFDQFSFASITDGTWDDHINEWADKIHDYGGTVVIAPLADVNREEMGVEELLNQAAAYQMAFRYIVEKFNEKKVKNVVWVWQVANDDALMSFENLVHLYPGDDVCDWIGMSLSYYPHRSLEDSVLSMQAGLPSTYKKPLMITMADIRSFPEQLDWVITGTKAIAANPMAHVVLLDVPEDFPFKSLKPAFSRLVFQPSQPKKSP